jgi:hypothetical protein
MDVVCSGPLYSLQRGPKVTSLVACSSRGRCAQHLRRIRGSGLNPVHMSRKCYTQHRVRCASWSPRIMQILRAPGVRGARNKGCCTSIFTMDPRPLWLCPCSSAHPHICRVIKRSPRACFEFMGPLDMRTIDGTVVGLSSSWHWGMARALTTTALVSLFPGDRVNPKIICQKTQHPSKYPSEVKGVLWCFALRAVLRVNLGEAGPGVGLGLDGVPRGGPRVICGTDKHLSLWRHWGTPGVITHPDRLEHYQNPQKYHWLGRANTDFIY